MSRAGSERRGRQRTTRHAASSGSGSPEVRPSPESLAVTIPLTRIGTSARAAVVSGLRGSKRTFRRRTEPPMRGSVPFIVRSNRCAAAPPVAAFGTSIAEWGVMTLPNRTRWFTHLRQVASLDADRDTTQRRSNVDGNVSFLRPRTERIENRSLGSSPGGRDHKRR